KLADQPGYTPDLDCYLRHGGYEMLKKALALQSKDLPDGKKISPQEQVRDEVMKSGLRGRGGAGFSCGLKWSFVDRKSGKPIYLICNADESEPGTFKDRPIIHKDPHQLIEGMILSCWANDVKLAYIYIRGEFAQGAKILNRALEEARDRTQVVVRGPKKRQADLSHLQCRRIRAGHVQGPPDHPQRPAPAHRRDDPLVLGERREARLHLHPRRVRSRREDFEPRS